MNEEDKISRSVRMNVDLYIRAYVVAETLGMSFNSFLISAVGEHVLRQEALISNVPDLVKPDTTAERERITRLMETRSKTRKK